MTSTTAQSSVSRRWRTQWAMLWAGFVRAMPRL